MNRVVSLLAVSSLLCTAATALAAPPTAEEVNRVMDYFNTGKDGGPILLELAPCMKIDKKPGEDRKSCIEPVAGPVAKKSVVNAWMRWFVPKGMKYEDLKVQFVHAGEVHDTKDFSIDTDAGSTNYGIYKAASMSKPGEWEIRVKFKDAVVGTAKVTVNP